MAAAMSFVGMAQAQILGELWQNVPTSISENALIGNQPAGSPDAEFDAASINFDSRVTGYTPALFLNHPTFFDTSGSFNPNGSLNNTYILFTGKIFLHAGANSLITPHDDGFELAIPGAGFDLKDPGPSSPANAQYTVNAVTDGLYDFTLSYGECCGAPAVLGVRVPDASSTLALLTGALGMLTAFRRRMLC
jgi:hypothetical protein